MIELIKIFLEKIDFLAIAETLRKRKNRQSAARLHLILVQSYEILEIYRVLLDELQAALKTHIRADGHDRFFLNPARFASLLQRQAANLEVMSHLAIDLMDELRILDNRFAEAYRGLFSGKWSILSAALELLAMARLPLSETGPDQFPASVSGECRTLWFTWDRPRDEDRRQVIECLYGVDSKQVVVDVNIHDSEAFFYELSRYLEEEKPYERLAGLERLTASYKEVLLKNFTVADLLSDIEKVRKHPSWK